MREKEKRNTQRNGVRNDFSNIVDNLRAVMTSISSENNMNNAINIQKPLLKTILNETEGIKEQDLAEFLGIEFSDILDTLSGVKELPENAVIGLRWLTWLHGIAKHNPSQLKPSSLKNFILKDKFKSESDYTKVGLLLVVDGF